MISKLKFNDKNYQIVRQLASEAYLGFKPVNCPALGNVNFTSEGFNHIVFKRPRSERARGDQFMRLKVLDIARNIIMKTTTIQEMDEKLSAVNVKRGGKRVNEFQLVKYWAFIAIVEHKKLKVIVRKVGNGNLHFWSVIPKWTTTEHGEVRLMDYTGSNLAEE